MRKLALTLLAAASLALMGVSPAVGHPPPTHLHCVMTPSGKIHSVARGVTLNAPHEPAFHNFHAGPHVGPGLNHFFAPDFTAPYTCPPSA
jgi:hypothetical protein